MGGFDDHVAVMGDWMALSPSPRPFLPSMTGDDVTAQPVVDSDAEIRNGTHFPGPEEHNASGIHGDQRGQTEVSLGSDEPRLSSKGGLMERIAARAGFNAPRLNTESIRPADLSKKQEVRSPYLTIPPGLSPTTLLDSPVFIQNSQVLPSPTTGQFLFAPGGNNRAVNPDDVKENTFQDVNASSFTFRPVAESAQFPYFNSANKSFPSDVAVSDHPNTSLPRQSIGPPTVQSENNCALFQQPRLSKIHTQNNESCNLLPEKAYDSVGIVEHSPPFDEQHQDADQRSSEDPNLGGAASEDGYNWRKYGQKQVKGSEFPRSYYKCTHQNCPVKKKVERSHEGHITEIIYKGAHNHPKPPPNRRSALGSSNDAQLDSEKPATGATGDHIWSAMHSSNDAGASDWKPNNLGAASSAPMGQEYSNVAAAAVNFHSQGGGDRYESGDGVDKSSAYLNDEVEDDRATHGSASLGYDGEGDESESKRRRIEAYAPEMTGATRAIREPRVVVQTTSEVDILDDGYRWRKYGQKVVKGNPNPRSYYKCTSPGCNVRKHVERACHDLKSVITTYEGKHNHDVPAARNSGGQMNTASSNTLSTPVMSHMHRPEGSQIRGGSPWFDRPPLASFGLPDRPQLGPGPGYGFGMNQHGLGGMGLPGLGPNQGKLPVLPVNPYMGNGVRPVNEMVYRGEPKMEPVTDSGLNSSNGSTAYQQFMNRQQM